MCFDRSWCFVYHPDDTPWRAGKSLSKLKKMLLQKSWKKTLSDLLTVSSTENSFQRAKPLKQCIRNVTEQLLKRMNWVMPTLIQSTIGSSCITIHQHVNCNNGALPLNGWLTSFVTHPICLTLLQLTCLSPKLQFALKVLHLQFRCNYKGTE